MGRRPLPHSGGDLSTPAVGRKRSGKRQGIGRRQDRNVGGALGAATLHCGIPHLGASAGRRAEAPPKFPPIPDSGESETFIVLLPSMA